MLYRHFRSEYYSILNNILDNNLNIIPDKITETHISLYHPKDNKSATMCLIIFYRYFIIFAQDFQLLYYNNHQISIKKSVTYIYQIYIHHALSFDRLPSPAFQDIYQSFLPLRGKIVLCPKSLYRLNHLIFIRCIRYIGDILKFCLSLQVFKQTSCPFLTIGSCTKVFFTESWNCHPVRYSPQSGLWLFCHRSICIFLSELTRFFPFLTS